MVVNSAKTMRIILLVTCTLQVQIAKVLLNKNKVKPKQIAAITSYSAQREEIKREMERQKVTGVQVKTITESQGNLL